MLLIISVYFVPNVLEIGQHIDTTNYKKLITRWVYPNVTWRTSSYLFTYLDMHWTGSSPIRHKVNLIQLKISELELDFAVHIYSTRMCEVRIFAGPPIYHLRNNVISVTVAFVYINVQPEHELSSSTRFSQFQKSGKKLSWATIPQATRKEKFCTGFEFLSTDSYLSVRSDIPLTSEI